MPLRNDVLAFDVNETLLDLRALDMPFTSVFGDASLRPVWFQTMLQLSFVGGLTSQYVDFTQAQTAALLVLAQRAGKALTPSDYDAIGGGMRRLPPHAGVSGALQRLRSARYRPVTRTI